jgi:predicted AlkP superfamily phosphohydrolase/phosphomutase
MVIGLDGLTLELLLPLVAAGQLPTFARLLHSGAYGVLHSVTNMTTGPTWASFATGCTPSRHGILHDFHHLPDSYALRPTNGSFCLQPTFWQLASSAGRTAIVLNVPQTFPARPLRGVLLSGVDAPCERAPGFCHPSTAYRELRRHAGDYVIDCGLASYMQAGQVAAGQAAVERETEGRTRAAEYWMQRLDWDLLVVVHSLPDMWQHYYWTARNDARQTVGRNLIIGAYQMVDRHVERLLQHLPPDGLVVVCSDHGFQPLCGTRDYVNAWLVQHGLLTYDDSERRSLCAGVSRRLLALLRRSLSFRQRQQLLASIPALRRTVETRLRLGGINWAQTQVYAALDHLELWVNLEGRQPLGCVHPADYDLVCQSVETALLDWRDERTGLNRITAVHRRPYGQAQAPDCVPPDLLLEWNSDAAPQGLHPLVTGDHGPDGTLIVAGGGVRPQLLEACSLLDVAPIALHALGVPAPSAMEGRVPAGLLTSSDTG